MTLVLRVSSGAQRACRMSGNGQRVQPKMPHLGLGLSNAAGSLPRWPRGARAPSRSRSPNAGDRSRRLRSQHCKQWCFSQSLSL
eukprot:1022437-Prymnesium_polylepis.1